MIDVTRADWGARPPLAPLPSVTHTHVEVHHSVGNYDQPTEDAARQVQQIHQNGQYDDTFYNVLIHRGQVIEGRGVGVQSMGTALTVCVIGNYEEDVLRDEDAAAIGRVLAAYPDRGPGAETVPDYHQARYNRTGEGHASACPGADIIRRIEAGQLIPTSGDDDLDATEKAQLSEVHEMVATMHHGHKARNKALLDGVRANAMLLGTILKTVDDDGSVNTGTPSGQLIAEMVETVEQIKADLDAHDED